MAKILYKEEEQNLLVIQAPKDIALQRGLVALRNEQMAITKCSIKEEILQTRNIPKEEIFIRKDEWIEAIVKEIKPWEEKITPQEMDSDKLEIIPKKTIHL